MSAPESRKPVKSAPVVSNYQEHKNIQFPSLEDRKLRWKSVSQRAIEPCAKESLGGRNNLKERLICQQVELLLFFLRH